MDGGIWEAQSVASVSELAEEGEASADCKRSETTDTKGRGTGAESRPFKGVEEFVMGGKYRNKVSAKKCASFVYPCHPFSLKLLGFSQIHCCCFGSHLTAVRSYF